MGSHRSAAAAQAGYLPSYPQFTGSEPCATMDPDMYFLDNPKERLDAYAFEARAKGCFVDCPMFAACLEWALYRERSGYWAGTTARERVLMRRDLGIVVVEPQYQDFDEDEDEDEFAA